MKRRIFAIALVFPLMLALMASAFAAEFRIERNAPVLTFDGNTATCSVSCRASNTTDKIEATLTLYQGNTYVNSWSESGTWRVFISETCKVKNGKDYQLVLEYSINGESRQPISTSATCP